MSSPVHTKNVDATPANRVERVVYRRLAWLAPLAALLAALVNTVLYFALQPLGAWPQDVIIPSSGQPMTLTPIVSFTVVSVLAAALVYAALGRFTRRPWRIFVIVAAVVFIGFLFTPFTIPGAPLVMRGALELVHIPPAVVALLMARRATETSSTAASQPGRR